MMSDTPLLDIADLRIAFRADRHTTVEAVKGVSFQVPRNATVALVGESGSGKSVSSLAVMGLLPPDATVIDPASRIRFDGRDLLALSAAERRALCGKDIAMIFQEPMSSLNPVFTVGAQIVEVLRLHMGMSPACFAPPLLVRTNNRHLSANWPMVDQSFWPLTT